MVRKKGTEKVMVSRERILRAVASSSAIEIGERTEIIEKRLKSRNRRADALTLRECNCEKNSHSTDY